MDRIGAMRLFVRAAELGTFSGAARDRGVGQPTVSKAIAALEDRLRVALFHRNSRRLVLTEAGHVYLHRCRRVLEEVDESDAAVGDSDAAAGGLIRVAAPATFGRLHIVPITLDILDGFPKLSVELRLSDHRGDLIEQGVDVAIRVGPFASASYTVVPLVKTRVVAVASKAYLDRRGRPQTPSELSVHNCLVYSANGSSADWTFDDGGRTKIRVHGNLRADNMDALRAGVLDGLGIAMMTAATVHEELRSGAVELVLGSFTPFEIAVSAIYPASAYPSGKRTLFLDEVRRRLQQRL